MNRAAVLVLLLAAVAGVCVAQVNFSPNWGKRAPAGAAGDDNNCRESVDTVMLIYKIIQNEAQKLVECEKFSN